MATRQTQPYSVHPSVATARAILDNLPAKTGRSLEEWIRLVSAKGPAGTKERREWLKREHRLGGTTAWMIVDRAEGRGAEDTDPAAYLASASRYVEEMYAGSKSGLRPIHDELIRQALSRHPDVRVCPCQTIVPMYRNHVIAQIKPSTKTRLDFGLALKGTSRTPPRRFVDTGGEAKGDRITHQVALTRSSEIDVEIWTWFGIAYGLDG